MNAKLKNIFNQLDEVYLTGFLVFKKALQIQKNYESFFIKNKNNFSCLLL